MRDLTSLTTLTLAYVSTTLPAPPTAAVEPSSAADFNVVPVNARATYNPTSLPSTLTQLNIDSSPGLVQLLASGTQRQCDEDWKSRSEALKGAARGATNSSCDAMKLRHLRQLYAKSSDLRTIDPDFALMFHEDATVALTSTSWHCDNRIRWFRDWLRASRHGDVDVSDASSTADDDSHFDVLRQKETASDVNVADAPTEVEVVPASRRNAPSGTSRAFKLYLVQSSKCDIIHDGVHFNALETRSTLPLTEVTRSSYAGFFLSSSTKTAPNSDEHNSEVLRPVPRIDARFEADNRCATPRALFGRTLLSLTDDELQTTAENHVTNDVTSPMPETASHLNNVYTICQFPAESHENEGE